MVIEDNLAGIHVHANNAIKPVDKRLSDLRIGRHEDIVFRELQILDNFLNRFSAAGPVVLEANHRT